MQKTKGIDARNLTGGQRLVMAVCRRFKLRTVMWQCWLDHLAENQAAMHPMHLVQAVQAVAPLSLFPVRLDYHERKNTQKVVVTVDPEGDGSVFEGRPGEKTVIRGKRQTTRREVVVGEYLDISGFLVDGAESALGTAFLGCEWWGYHSPLPRIRSAQTGSWIKERDFPLAVGFRDNVYGQCVIHDWELRDHRDYSIVIGVKVLRGPRLVVIEKQKTFIDLLMSSKDWVEAVSREVGQ